VSVRSVRDLLARGQKVLITRYKTADEVLLDKGAPFIGLLRKNRYLENVLQKRH
jgi:hypothetical protein